MTLRIYCSSCSAEVRDDSNICPACGVPLDDVATRRLESHKSPSHKSVSFDSLDNARFVPVEILSETNQANDER